MSFYSAFWCFDISESCWPCRDCPFRGQLMPSESKHLTCEPAFHMQTNQFRTHIPNHCLWWVLTHWAITPLTSSPQIQIPRDSPSLGDPWNYSNLPILNLLTLPCPPSCRNHNKGSCPRFSLSLLPTDLCVHVGAKGKSLLILIHGLQRNKWSDGF